MKHIHNVTLRVFVKPGEDKQAIQEGLQQLSGLNKTAFADEDPKKRVVIKCSAATGFNNEKIQICELYLDKQKLCKAFLTNLLSTLSQEQKELISKQRRTRLDEQLHFFLRFKKQELMQGVYELTDSGDCYHVRLSIAAFPSKREIALQVVEEMLQLSK